jgi:hypothetical protein
LGSGVTDGSGRRAARAFARALAAATAVALSTMAGCGPLVDRAPFPVRPDSVRPADLLGPYDGIVVDADSDRPVAGALVSASWGFERGVGFQAPLASEEVVTETGADGRYQIPRLDSLPSGLSTRVRRFTVIVYHRGHVGWRSDWRFPSHLARRDFSQRGNRVRLEKWQSSYLHSDHLIFLGGGSRVRASASWEVQPAALEMEGTPESRSGAGGPLGQLKPGPRPASPRTTPLDISHLLTDDEIRGVTGYVGKFEDGKLVDLPTTEFYDSRHFKAVGKPESYDVGVRVWRLGAAAEVQYQKLLAELPGAKPTDEIGDASLRAQSGTIAGLAFLVRDRGAVVSLTCGASQCTEPGMLLRLAKLVESRLPELPAETPAAPAAPSSGSPSGDDKSAAPRVPAPTNDEDSQ